MATKKVFVAGFGGQGVLLIGQMLAYAAMYEGKEATWMPSYGPEMRGGTANCTVCISDKPHRVSAGHQLRRAGGYERPVSGQVLRICWFPAVICS